MNRNRRSGLILSLVLTLVVGIVTIAPLTARATGETITVPVSNVATSSSTTPITGIHVNGVANSVIPVKVEVTNGTLSFTNTNNVTFGGGIQSGSVVYLSGTVSDVNTVLSTLSYYGTTVGAQTLTVSLIGYGQVFYPANGHLYEYITYDGTQHYTWQMAQLEAATHVKYGAQGYLATVTSQGENDFINARLLGAGWMAASDNGHEGDWQWTNGPETGQSFWSGAVSGSPVNGRYAAWETAQPDNSYGTLGFNEYENCAQFGLGASLTGRWNDLPCSLPLPGYVVEYGAPGNMPIVQQATTQLLVTAAGAMIDDGDGIDANIEDAGPLNGDANGDGTLDSMQSNAANFVNPLTGKRVALAVDPSCNITRTAIAAAATTDATYVYPNGLFDFTAECSAPGVTTNVELYYFDTNNGTAVRKYDPRTMSYEAVNGAAKTSVTIGSQQAIKVAYQVIDGGPLDTDGLVDGVISDPVGIATDTSSGQGVDGNTLTGQVSAVQAPRTGLQRSNTNSIGLFVTASILAVGLMCVVIRLTLYKLGN